MFIDIRAKRKRNCVASQGGRRAIARDLQNSMAAGSLAIAAFVAGTNIAWAGSYSILYSFSGSPDGSVPSAAMVRDKAGNLLGTTFDGGSGTANCLTGCGTVFKIAANGTETVLYSFQGDTDGAGPASRLIEDAAGNLYGTTEFGGNGANCTQCGTVFKLAPDGTETILNQFVAGTDGAGPVGDLVMDSKGNLFGTTTAGGGSANCTDGCGTIYEVASGGETVLHAFQGSDGRHPSSGLLADAKGNLYGTTDEGGSKDSGTVFELTRAHGGWSEKLLHSFKGGKSDGMVPSGLIADAAGNLFGTTLGGGAGNICPKGCGTVFELAAGGQESILYSFLAKRDGALAAGDLAGDSVGNLYGTALLGGSKSVGTVFKLAPGGTVTVLHAFGDQTGDGANPVGVIADTKGHLYGATSGGGSGMTCSGGCGTVFRISE